MAQSGMCHLCSQLTAVDLAENDIEYHPNLSCLREAAKAGCPLCSLVMKRFSTDLPESVLAALFKGETPVPFDGVGPLVHQMRIAMDVKPAEYHQWKAHNSPKECDGERLWVSIGEGSPKRDAIGDPSGYGVTLEAFVSEKSPLSSLIAGRLFSSKHDRNSFMPFVLRNLGECERLHAECRGGFSDNFMPTRILEVTDDNGLRLVPTEGLQASSYAALSYCWGTSPPALRLTAETHTAMLLKIDHASLSKAHREAIQITLELGLRYLWIDALCIIQGDPQDWARESLLMASVYGNAAITIIAGRSNDASFGFVDRSPSVEEDALPECWIPYSRDCSERVHITSNRGFLHGPTSTRAWCMQEEVLSRRAIVFAEDQLIFKCRRSRTYETGEKRQSLGPTDIFRTLLPVEQKDSPERRKKVLGAWYELLRMLSQRNISNPHDIFGCMASLAKVVGDILGSRYLAGIWEQDLVRGLMWKPEHTSSFVGPVITWNRTPITRPQPTQFAPAPVIRAPSWSWASVQGSVQLWPMGTFRPEGKRPKTFDRGWEALEHAKIKPSLKDGSWTADKTCGVEALFMPTCQLHISGRLRRAYVGRYVHINMKRWRNFPGMQRTQLEYRGLVQDAEDLENMPDIIDNVHTCAVAFAWFDVPEEACAEVWCLQVTNKEGLMLIGHDDKWKRAGVFWLMRSDWFESVEAHEVLLV